MLSKDREQAALETTESLISVTSGLVNSEELLPENQSDMPNKFYGHYSDRMDLSAPATVVADYLNRHQEWFVRCAEPMKVNPLGENGYALGIGKFGAFGYEVEPKIGLELLPPDDGIYRICTVPIPDYTPPGYDVDYRAALQLVEQECGTLTHVEWKLDLTVYLHFPRFIQRLPKSLIQKTGDRLLNQIVRQVSRRLTRKVQCEFHSSLGIDFPPNKKR